MAVSVYSVRPLESLGNEHCKRGSGHVPTYSRSVLTKDVHVLDAYWPACAPTTGVRPHVMRLRMTQTQWKCNFPR